MCRIALIAAVCGFLLNLVAVSSSCSNSDFVDTEWQYTDGRIPDAVRIVGACIESSNFKLPVFKMVVSESSVPTLTIPVQNFSNFTSLCLKSCKVSIIKEKLFKNLPNLQIIQFSLNYISRIPANAFSEMPLLQTLSLDKNNIVNIEKYAFSNNPSLSRVLCRHNFLQNWDITWFTNTTNVQIINFDSNKITALPAKAFYRLEKLKKIHFNFNEMNTIHANAFKGLKKLEYLGLAYNKLRVLEACAFPNALVVQKLSLHANYLNVLSANLMERVTAVQLGMDSNPWSCLCLDSIFDWLLRNNGSTITSDLCNSHGIPVCAYPDTADSKNCTEAVDGNLTVTYLNGLRETRSYFKNPVCFLHRDIFYSKNLRFFPDSVSNYMQT